MSETKQIETSGVVVVPVTIPAASVLETYTLETTADFSNNTTMISSLIN